MSILNWNEIRSRAVAFSHEWASETSERAESQSFWNEFFEIFGVRRRNVATYELNRRRLGQNTGFIDLFWPGTLLVEHKSRGEDLGSAFLQAGEYLAEIRDSEYPRYVIVSDFEKIRLYDLEQSESGDVEFECRLTELSRHIRRFGFIAGYTTQSYQEESPANKNAVDAVALIHDDLKTSNYLGHKLEILLVRLVFCAFADDTGIFERDWFRNYIVRRTSVDGSDLGGHLGQIFQILATPIEDRQTTLDEDLQELPYVNGQLFDEQLPLPSFNSQMRQLLIDCCNYDWSGISPAIFGSMFQAVMDTELRHELGGHYTSEKNILKVIKSLFLDDLKKEFNQVKTQPRKLREFHEKLATLKFFDPACGCGNFLVVTYKELRLLELEVLKLIHIREIAENQHATQRMLLTIDSYSKINVDCLYGAEIEEFPSRIAELAIWLTDHQMNMKLGQEFGQYYARLPLRTSPHIYNVNILHANWEQLFPKSENNYILGNPPFVSKQKRNEDQIEDMNIVFSNRVHNHLELDYVSAWYIKALDYIQDTNIEVAYVSTNSINQGEQVIILWKYLIEKRITINFAHRTFKWMNEARNRAAVYCVIIGFSFKNRRNKYIFEYETPQSDPLQVKATNINPYLIDFDNMLITSRRAPISPIPPILYGSKPVGGSLLLTDKEKDNILSRDNNASPYILPLISAKEYLHGMNRWCLWLVNASPEAIREIQPIYERVQQVRNERLVSRKEATRRLAEKPYMFAEIRQPTTKYILIPIHSSENRKYVPFSFFEPNVIVHNSCTAIPNATLFDFGIMQSLMHMEWMRTVCGRLESRYRYSNELVYNNFPWPANFEEAKKTEVEKAAQKILDIRTQFPNTILADLYNPLSMPVPLLEAHKALDAKVDSCYGKKNFKIVMERVEYLFGLYKQYTSPLVFS